MDELEQAIHAVEHGLLKPKGKTKRPRKPMDLAKRMAYYNVPGLSIILIQQGKQAWTQCYGLMEAGTSRAVTPETIFQAASISKPVSAILALQLVEAGLLDLDADARDFLHSWQFPQSKHLKPQPDGTQPKVTLRGLLSHTAGIGIFGYRGYPAGEPLPTLQQILNGESPATSKPVRVVLPPGKEVKYSGGGYLIVQQMIEDVTGCSFPELAQERILDPLGMTSSTFQHILPDKFTPRAATGHLKTGDPVPGRWHTYPENAAASLWSTPTDLTRLAAAVYATFYNEPPQLLSPEMTREMLTSQMGIGGLGFFIIESGGRKRFEHPGWNEGFHSLLINDLTTGQGVVWMTNGENGRKLGWEITRGLAKVFGWTWN